MSVGVPRRTNCGGAILPLGPESISPVMIGQGPPLRNRPTPLALAGVKRSLPRAESLPFSGGDPPADRPRGGTSCSPAATSPYLTASL